MDNLYIFAEKFKAKINTNIFSFKKSKFSWSIFRKNCAYIQNRRQKVFNRGVLQFCGGLEIIRLTKTPHVDSVSRFNLGWLGTLFGGAKPTKPRSGDGTAYI